MPWDFILRAEVSTPLSRQDNDDNWTKAQSAVNYLEAVVTSLTALVNQKIGALEDDATPSLGGALDGELYPVRNVLDQTISKTLPFTYNPDEGRVVTYVGTAAATVTLPTNLGVCPVGIGFEINVKNSVVLTLQTDQTSPTVGRPDNFDGHYKLTGPNGVGFLRVTHAVASKASWQLTGHTVP